MAEALTSAGHDDVIYVGTSSGPEARLAREAGVVFHSLPARGFDRSRPLSLLLAILVLTVSTIRALFTFLSHRPDVVVGFGGYVSIPVGLAAVVARIPLVLHEQNSIPGLANRILARHARAVAVTYPSSVPYLRQARRVVETGNPVRSQILRADRERGRRRFELPGDAVMLLVFGGSRGARHINQALARVLTELLGHSDVHIVHVTGRSEYEDVLDLTREAVATGRYHVVEYIDDMGSALAAADVVLARAGATSIAEITALGRPAVLVPYPYATDDHQTSNARAVADAGGAVLLADERLDSDDLTDVLTRLLTDEAERITMAMNAAKMGHPEAAENVAQLVVDVADGPVHGTRKEPEGTIE